MSGNGTNQGKIDSCLYIPVFRFQGQWIIVIAAASKEIVFMNKIKQNVNVLRFLNWVIREGQVLYGMGHCLCINKVRNWCRYASSLSIYCSCLCILKPSLMPLIIKLHALTYGTHFVNVIKSFHSCKMKLKNEGYVIEILQWLFP